jgi:hypothetical protein
MWDWDDGMKVLFWTLFLVGMACGGFLAVAVYLLWRYVL